MMQRTLMARFRKGEDVSNEFVGRAGSLEAIAKTAVAFLNTAGGTIYIGVGDDGTVHGIEEPVEQTAENIERMLNERISPSSFVTVNVQDVGDDPIIVIDVPAGQDRPYVFDGSIFTRSGSRTKPADSAVIRKLVQGQIDTPQRWERRLSPSMTDDDLAVDEVLATARDAREQDAGFADIREPHQILRRLSMWRSEGYTQGGDVLFSNDPSTRHPQCRVQFVVFEDDKAGDEYHNLKWLTGPLLEIANQVSRELDSLNASQVFFSEDSLKRDQRTRYAPRALREALVNALVHRDYSAYSGGARIAVYPSRIEFWNSGNLPEELSTSDLKREHPSVPVNPDIAKVFYLRGQMEQLGRGTLKIIRACEDIGARKPRWENRKSGVTLTIYAADEPPPNQPDFNERQKAFLESIEPGASISPADYASTYAEGLTARSVRRDLVDLEDRGYVRREGAGPATVYVRLDR
ncbi:RNA-binding domain-containing protein [Pacificimonas sp. ICDLI1SI03]